VVDGLRRQALRHRLLFCARGITLDLSAPAVMAYPFVFLFFGAIIGSPWFRGAICGMIAVALSSFVINFFFIPPLYSITVAKEFRTFLAAFILCAFAIAIVSSARKRAENASRLAREQLEAKVQERTAELERSNLEIKEGARQLIVLTEAIPQQIWRAGADGRIEYCNQHFARLCRGTGLAWDFRSAEALSKHTRGAYG
jgi:K+-sensing histidine kinase KdpD